MSRSALSLMLIALGAGVGAISSTAVAQQRAPVRATAVAPTPVNAARAAPGSPSSDANAPTGVVNINTAGDEELQRLPGIGPARAAAILALRQRVQHFRAVDDLMRVRGIGRASMRHLRPMLVLQGETTLMSRPGRARRADAE